MFKSNFSYCTDTVCTVWKSNFAKVWGVAVRQMGQAALGDLSVCTEPTSLRAFQPPVTFPWARMTDVPGSFFSTSWDLTALRSRLRGPEMTDLSESSSSLLFLPLLALM